MTMRRTRHAEAATPKRHNARLNSRVRFAFENCFCSRLKWLPALALAALVASCGGGGGGGNGGGGGSTQTPYMYLTATPESFVTYPSSSFTALVRVSSNSSATPTLTSITLPAGVTTSASFPLTVPNTGASLTFQTSASVAGGAYEVTINGAAGSLTSSVSLNVTIETTPPSFTFVTPLSSEVWMTFGGTASIQYPTIQEGTGPLAYTVQLSLSGLPPGVTATVSPENLTVGQTVSITLSASSSAPEAQNIPITLTGTANAPITPVTAVFLLDVTPAAGLLPDNRTDYLSTEDTPFGAVYDPVHNLIFASNSSWNRVEVISTRTHTFQTRIPLPDPRGIDISQDNSTVWVATGSHQVFAINTSSLAVTNYQLPPGSPAYWEGYQVLALADGTLMVQWTAGLGTGSFGLAIWNPTSNQWTSLQVPDYNAVEFLLVIRSGDGTRVYFIDETSAGSAFYYDVLAKSFSNPVTLGGYAMGAAVNGDGSQVMVCDMNGANLYNENWHILSWVPPGCGGFLLSGGSIFSPDNRYLYQEVPTDPPLISKFDTSKFSVVSVAPAMPFMPFEEELSQLFYLPTPFGVDSSGMVFGIQNWGIAFDDSAYAQNYVAVTSLPDVPSTPLFYVCSHGVVRKHSGDFQTRFVRLPDRYVACIRHSGAGQREDDLSGRRGGF